MTGFVAVFLTVLAAANPPTVPLTVAWPRTEGRAWTLRVLGALVTVTALLIVVAIVSDPILDLLSVTIGTFRLATSVLLAFAGLRWLLLPARPVTDAPSSPLVGGVLALTLLFTPQLVAVTIATAGKDGAWPTSISLVVAAGAAAGLLLWNRVPDAILGAVARLLGGLAIVFAITLGVDGTKTI